MISAEGNVRTNGKIPQSTSEGCTASQALVTLSHCGMQYCAVQTRKGTSIGHPVALGVWWSQHGIFNLPVIPSTPSLPVSHSLHCSWLLSLTAAPHAWWAWFNKLSSRITIIVTQNYILFLNLCLTSHVEASFP